jgi:hypothetical protein
LFINGVDVIGTTWYLGLQFMDKYYTVFDASAIETTGTIQIGLAVKNPINQIAKQQYDPTFDLYWPLDKNYDQSNVTDGS